MTRQSLLPALLAPIFLASAPGIAAAQTAGDPPPPWSVDLEARGEYTDNALLVANGTPRQADQILIINPSFQANATTTGLKASINYALNYYSYSKEPTLDRVLQTLNARAALVRWDQVDLDAQELLAPQPLSYADPLLDPVNDVQSNQSSAHAGFHWDFNPSNRINIGYRGTYVTYFKVNSSDTLLPSFLIQGPEAGGEHDFGPRTTVGLIYKYQLENFSNLPADQPQPPNWQGHVGEGTVRSTPTEWLGLSARAGIKSITYSAYSSTLTRWVADGDAKAGSELASVDLRLSHDVTQDVLGNPATVTSATLAGDYDPPGAPWTARIGASYGMLQLLYPETFTAGALPTGLTTNQGYVEGSASFSYRINAGVITLAAMHHESTTTVESVSGSSKVVVTQGTLSVGGRF